MGSTAAWLSSNMFEANGEPLLGCESYKIFEREGITVGVLGLAEDWIYKTCLDESQFIYQDLFEAGESMAKMLKREKGCHVVLALTHNRLENDKEFMKKCPSVDLLLGGHDHFYYKDMDERIVKSGQEWEHLSRITITMDWDKLPDDIAANMAGPSASNRSAMTMVCLLLHSCTLCVCVLCSSSLPLIFLTVRQICETEMVNPGEMFVTLTE